MIKKSCNLDTHFNQYGFIILKWIVVPLLLLVSCATIDFPYVDVPYVDNPQLTDTVPVDTNSNEGQDMINPLPTTSVNQDELESPANSASINPEEYEISLCFQEPIRRYGDSSLLFVREQTIGSNNERGGTVVEAFDWDGNQGSLLNLTYEEEERTGLERITVEPIFGFSPRVLISYEENYVVRQFFYVDLLSRELQAFRPSCERFAEGALFENLFLWRCTEDIWNWYLIEIAENEVGTSSHFRLIGSDDGLFFPERIISSRLIFRESFNQEICSLDILNRISICKEVEYWLGPISPDGHLIEVRHGYDYDPEMVGVMDTECLLNDHVDCVARLSPLSNGLPRSDEYWYLGDAAWLPDGSGLLYLVELETNRSNHVTDEREIWLYDIETQMFDFVGRYEIRLGFGNNSIDSARYPPPWSPDGSSVVMSVGEQYYLFNVETAELTPLTEGGILLGAITLP